MKTTNTILYALSAAVLMVGCSKVEPKSFDAENLGITFQVGNYAPATKAEGDTKPYVAFEGEDFGTFCEFTPGNFNGGSGTTYMDDVLVMKSGDQWKPGKMENGNFVPVSYFWPKAGKLSFVSYAPYAAGSYVELVKDYANEKYNVRFNDYTVANDDLMYSIPALDKTANEKTYDYNGVPTLFHHALSLVTFSFSNAEGLPEGAHFVIEEAYITDVAQTGSYTGTGESKIWEATKNPKNITIFTTKEDDTQEGVTFYAMPQPLEDAESIDMKLNIKAKMLFKVDGIEDEVATNISVTGISIATEDIPAWLSGKHYHYNIVLSGDSALIKFRGIVEDWTEENRKEEI